MHCDRRAERQHVKPRESCANVGQSPYHLNCNRQPCNGTGRDSVGNMPSTLANIGYNSIAKVLTMAVGVATSAILARNLGADDYGVVGIAMIVIGFLGRFSDIGMTAALVQRPRIDERVLETAQTLNLILAAVLFACALAAAPFVAVVFKNYAVPQVVSVLACSLLISAIGFLPSALLVHPRVGCGERKLRHCPSAWGKAHLWIFTEVADENHFVDRGHDKSLLRCTVASQVTVTTQVCEVNH